MNRSLLPKPTHSMACPWADLTCRKRKEYANVRGKTRSILRSFPTSAVGQSQRRFSTRHGIPQEGAARSGWHPEATNHLYKVCLAFLRARRERQTSPGRTTASADNLNASLPQSTPPNVRPVEKRSRHHGRGYTRESS